MMDDGTQDLLLQFRESIIIPLAETDADKWPIRSGRIGRLCLGEFSHEFFDDIHFLQQEMTIGQIAQLFGYPTRLWRMSHHLLTGMRLRSMPLETLQESILTVLDLISHLKYGDPYCSNGANIIWSPTRVSDESQTLRPVEGAAAMARTIHQLAAVLWAYTECLYFVAHELSVEIHGPYTLSDGKSLLVRDFFDLRPQALWPGLDCLLTVDTVRILTTYQRFDAHLDVYNNLRLDSHLRLTDELRFSSVLIDGEPADLPRIQQLIAEASSAIRTISDLVNGWSLAEIAQQYILLFWWRKAVLRAVQSQDWRPAPEILERATGKIPDPMGSNPSIDELRKQYQLV
ncbi:MAG TPA: hypothetical protein VKR06_26940 [Ktedonosporobacter sp.]|nr:hypothetical protein [Ktedonosporobacter sp.]